MCVDTTVYNLTYLKFSDIFHAYQKELLHRYLLGM